MACSRCTELEAALQEALAKGEPEELMSGASEEEVKKLKASVRKAQLRARTAEKKSIEIIEQSKPYILELGKWRTALNQVHKHCDEDGKKLIEEMFDWYAVFLLGYSSDVEEGHPLSGMCVECPCR